LVFSRLNLIVFFFLSIVLNELEIGIEDMTYQEKIEREDEFFAKEDYLYELNQEHYDPYWDEPNDVPDPNIILSEKELNMLDQDIPF